MTRNLRLLAIAALLFSASAAHAAKPSAAVTAQARRVLASHDAIHYGVFPAHGSPLTEEGWPGHTIEVKRDTTKDGRQRERHFVDGTHVRTDLTHPRTGVIVSYRKGLKISSFELDAKGRVLPALADAEARSTSRLFGRAPSMRRVVTPLADGKGVRLESAVLEGLTGVHARDGREIGTGFAHLMGPRRELHYQNGTSVAYRPHVEWTGPAGARTYTRGTLIDVRRKDDFIPTTTFRPGVPRAAD